MAAGVNMGGLEPLGGVVVAVVGPVFRLLIRNVLALVALTMAVESGFEGIFGQHFAAIAAAGAPGANPNCEASTGLTSRGSLWSSRQPTRHPTLCTPKGSSVPHCQ